MTLRAGQKKTGPAIGGPADGQELSANCSRIIVPIQNGPNRGPGDRGFGEAAYDWIGAAWIWRGDEPAEKP